MSLKKNLKKQNLSEQVDIRDQDGGGWLYTETVKDHFFNPRKFMRYDEEEKFEYNGIGRVGSPACGDEMVFWIQVDEKDEKIKDCRWRTFGCGSAIASTSVLAEMVTENGGMELEKALKIKPQDILERLGGLPDRKIHCSVLGDKALLSAVNDYFRRTGQHDRVKIAGAKIIDEKNRISDHDVEEAVLQGVQDLEALRKKLNIKEFDEDSIQQIEELVRFYNEKYYF